MKTDSEDYLTIFENENKVLFENKKGFSFTKSDELWVNDILGFIPKKVLISRNYSVEDSIKRPIRSINIWREGILKDDHFDEITFSEFTYKDTIISKYTVLEITQTFSHSYLGEKYSRKTLEYYDKSNYLKRRKFIDYFNSDTTVFSYDFNRNEITDFYSKKILDHPSNKHEKILFDGKVMLSKSHNNANLYVFEKVDVDSLKKYFTTYCTINYYDDTFQLYKVVLNKNFVIDTIYEYEYDLISKGNKTIKNIYVNSKLSKSLVWSVEKL